MSDTTTEEILDLYDISNDEIINFAYLYDDKNTSLKNIENKIIDDIQNSANIEKAKIFYLNHLDLFVSNQNKFKNIIRNQNFLDEYMKYRIAFTNIKSYIDSMSLYNSLSSETSMLSETSKKYSKSKFNIFEKKMPVSSIFYKVEVTNFAKICHKIYLAYYFLTEIRQYQYYSKVSSRELTGYAFEFSNFYDNFYRKLESEIEIFCDANNFSLLTDIFITLSTYFLDVGNIPLAQICINLMNRFEICKQKKIEAFLQSYNLSYPLDTLSLKDYKKFTYLVDPISINRAFITAQETESKIKTFSFIQTKMVKTKDEILSYNITSTKPTFDDFVVFNYLNPKSLIKEKLYKTASPGSIEYLCIQQKCK